MDSELVLSGAPEEWLRRIATGPLLLMTVPERIAAALLMIGFAIKLADGSLKVTVAGAAHLAAQGIPLAARPRRRP